MSTLNIEDLNVFKNLTPGYHHVDERGNIQSGKPETVPVFHIHGNPFENYDVKIVKQDDRVTFYYLDDEVYFKIIKSERSIRMSGKLGSYLYGGMFVTSNNIKLVISDAFDIISILGEFKRMKSSAPKSARSKYTI